MPISHGPSLIRRPRVLIVFAFLPLLLLWPSRVARADEIAIWNFNDSNLIVDHGAGTLVASFTVANVGFAAGTGTNARQGDPAGQALNLASSANNGQNITFSVSTVGFANILVSFATQRTSTGFNGNQVQYSLDGATFVNFNAPYNPAAAFGATPTVFDLSSIGGLNNNPNAGFRIVFNGATSGSGTNRLDNFVVEGTQATTTIPEPTTMLTLGTGLTGLGAALRRKLRARRRQ